ncbi:MAG: radical SAM protein, partial [bacterium]
VYVPRMYEPRYGDDGQFLAVEERVLGLPALERRWVRVLDGLPAVAPIVTPETDFGEKTIVEMMRGCGRQCRFCVAGYAYRPPRFRSRDAIMDAAARALSCGSGIALLGPSLTDHPDFEEVSGEIVKMGGRLSISSVRPGRVEDRLLRILVQGGLRSLTIAPETPVGRLQRKLNKEIHAAELLRFAECARGAGLKELKLYYLLGIEGETGEDCEAIVEEVRSVASRIAVRVSLGPLVPKARTPLQWSRMPGEKELRNKYNVLRRSIANIPAVRMSSQSIRGALVEAALSRGDRRLTPHLIAGKLPRSAVEEYALRRRGEHEPFPWEHVGAGVKREYLWAEYQKYLSEEITSPCVPGDCFTCGVCGLER